MLRPNNVCGNHDLLITHKNHHNKTMKVVLALLASLAVVPAAVADTDVVLTGGTCNPPWYVTVSSTCGNDPCSTIEITSTFDTVPVATVTVFYIPIAEQQVNICNYIEPLDGQECGEPGMYSADTTVTIPYNLSSIVSYIPVTVTLESITTCTIYVSSAQSSSSMGMAAAVLVGALVMAAIFNVRRRRRRRVENESLRWTLTDFEMPPEDIRKGVHV